MFIFVIITFHKGRHTSVDTAYIYHIYCRCALPWGDR